MYAYDLEVFGVINCFLHSRHTDMIVGIVSEASHLKICMK